MSEIATLASVNHMICSLIYRGKTYYLDATNEYINAEFIPESIQGREAVIENGENCIVHTLPTVSYTHLYRRFGRLYAQRLPLHLHLPVRSQIRQNQRHLTDGIPCGPQRA